MGRKRYPDINKLVAGLKPESRVFRVPTSLDSDTYERVSLFEGTCTCSDPHPRCEHIIAAQVRNADYGWHLLP